MYVCIILLGQYLSLVWSFLSCPLIIAFHTKNAVGKIVKTIVEAFNKRTNHSHTFSISLSIQVIIPLGHVNPNNPLLCRRRYNEGRNVISIELEPPRQDKPLPYLPQFPQRIDYHSICHVSLLLCRRRKNDSKIVASVELETFPSGLTITRPSLEPLSVQVIIPYMSCELPTVLK